MIESLAHFSTYTLAATMVFLFVVLSLIALRLVRRFCKPLLFSGHTEFGQIFAGAIGVVFALILAFVAVAVWQNYDKVDDDVSRETNALNNLYRNLETYPEPVHTQAKKLISQYVQIVIKDEWPQQARGISDRHAGHLLNRLQVLIVTFKPHDYGELAIHQETIRQLSEYSGLRHNRLIGGRSNLTPPIWVTLIGGTILYLMFLCFLDIPDERHHHIMIGALAAFLGLVYFLLLTYNYPFAEPGAVTPAAFKQLLEYWKIDMLLPHS